MPVLKLLTRRLEWWKLRSCLHLSICPCHVFPCCYFWNQNPARTIAYSPPVIKKSTPMFILLDLCGPSLVCSHNLDSRTIRDQLAECVVCTCIHLNATPVTRRKHGRTLSHNNTAPTTTNKSLNNSLSWLEKGTSTTVPYTHYPDQLAECLVCSARGTTEQTVGPFVTTPHRRSLAKRNSRETSPSRHALFITTACGWEKLKENILNVLRVLSTQRTISKAFIFTATT